MAYMLREGNVTIVHCDGDKIRATYGVQEFFVTPTVTLDATYAVPVAGSSRTAEASRAASAAPHANGDGDVDVDMANGATKADGEETAEGSRSGWLVGEDLTKALVEEGAGERYEQKWPFRTAAAGQEDWEGRAFLLTHLLTRLGLKIQSNTSPLLLIPPPSPPSLPLPHQALWAQLAFEELNVPALSLLPTPLASMYALGVTSGIVLHVGRDRSEIAIVTDSIMRWECSTTVQVGYADCEEWFEDLLMKDEELDQTLRSAAGTIESWVDGQKAKLVKEVAHVIWNECTGEDLEVTPADGGAKVQAALAAPPADDDSSFDVAKKLVGEPAPAAVASHKQKKLGGAAAASAAAAANKAAAAADAAAAAAAAEATAAQADVITINIPSLPEKDITVGAVRHRLCEPLLRGTARSHGDTVWEGMGRAIETATMSPADKMAVWEGVGVVGELAKIKSFGPALLTYLAPFLLSSTDLPSEAQSSRVRLLSIPDYFANFKGSTSELAPFLGGTMVAKVAFSDQAGKHCITKVDYNTKGPTSVYSVFTEQER